MAEISFERDAFGVGDLEGDISVGSRVGGYGP